MNRYLREKTSWDPHLEKTRRFIESSFTGGNVKKVAVLGSGWLLDVPLESLRERFDKVFLADIFHPPQIRKKTGPMLNVELVEADLTGGAVMHTRDMVRGLKRRPVKGVEEIGRMELTPPLEHLPVDAFISVNLLNQLDILLADYLRKTPHYRKFPAESFREKIQSFHLKWMTAQRGCLVTDARERTINMRSGSWDVRSLLHAPLPGGFRHEQWEWDFDTHGSYRPGTLTRMEVEAVEWK